MTTEIIRNFSKGGRLEANDLEVDKWYVDRDGDILYVVKGEGDQVHMVYLAEGEQSGYTMSPRDFHSDYWFREIKATITFSYL